MILAILSIIAVWMFQIPLAWAVTITVFSVIAIISFCCEMSLAVQKIKNNL